MSYRQLLMDLMNTDSLTVLATATTGVSDHDELIAVSTATLGNDTSKPRGKFMMRKVPVDKLLPAQQYHGISEQQMQEHGMDDDSFKACLADAINGAPALLVYNPGFQKQFLDPYLPSEGHIDLLNLPLLVKGAMAGIMLFQDKLPNARALEDTFYKIIGAAPNFKRFCEQMDIRPRYDDLLPVEASCDCLEQALLRLDAYQEQLQRTLF